MLVFGVCYLLNVGVGVDGGCSSDVCGDVCVDDEDGVCVQIEANVGIWLDVCFCVYVEGS